MDKKLIDGIWWALFGEMSYEEVMKQCKTLEKETKKDKEA